MRNILTVTMAVLLSLCATSVSYAQRVDRCGSDILMEHLRAVVPNADAKLQKTLEDNVAFANSYKSNLKTTAGEVIIPVVFHIVLNESQINRLGGEAGIVRRIDSQLAVLNRDYNAENSDYSKIPDGFKPLYGNAGIKFGLAHTDDNGASTTGYEIISISNFGINESGPAGSGMGFAEAKILNGKPNAWNPDKYLNIWVINPLSDGKAASILGMCIPPSFMNYGIPGMTKNELGVVLNYGAFGVRTSINEHYIGGITGGRTLTHEIGHYFELRHIWGDDDGKCVGNGGKDDGIADTPPQAGASYGSPVAPLYDDCTRTGDGVMFMNYMDYVDDAYMHMFTKGQVSLMRSNTVTGRASYTLTQNPHLLAYPLAVNDVNNHANVFTLYPNPASRMVHLSAIKDVTSVKILDMSGRVVKELANNGQTEQAVDISSLQPGMYMVQAISGTGTAVQKLMVQ